MLEIAKCWLGTDIDVTNRPAGKENGQKNEPPAATLSREKVSHNEAQIEDDSLEADDVYAELKESSADEVEKCNTSRSQKRARKAFRLKQQWHWNTLSTNVIQSSSTVLKEEILKMSSVRKSLRIQIVHQ